MGDDKWESEVRMAQLEAKVQSLMDEVAALKISDVERKAEVQVMREMLKKSLGSKESTWQLKRIDLTLPKLEKIQLHQVAPTIVDTVGFPFPNTTKAVIVSVFCSVWNKGQSHAYLSGEIRQNGSDPDGVVKISDQHFEAYANTWYYEVFVPWNTSLPNELELKVTSSYHTGGDNNWYKIKVVGYVSV